MIQGESMAVSHLHAEPNRLALNRAGLLLFISSEAMLFAAMFVARLYLAGLERPADVNEPLGAALTATLLISSLLAYRAEKAIAAGNRAAMLRFLLGALLAGVLFVVGVGVEWSSARFPVGSSYGTAFFATTGLHLAHLLSGLAVLGLVFRLGRHGHFSAESHWGVSAAVRYWTFVDLMWLFGVYPLLYLL